MTDIQTTPETHTIPEYRFEEFVKRFEKLVRKAKKLKVDVPTYEVVGTTVLEVEDPRAGNVEEGCYVKRKPYKVPCKVVAVRGVAPRVEGYQFIARIEYLAGDTSKKLFHTVPGVNVKIDERFRDFDFRVCEHCNTARFRKDTFVVQCIETGVQKQIGRNCLADYIGGRSPEAVAAWASYIDLFSNWDPVGGGDGFTGFFADRADTLEVLKMASAYISVYGWVPRSQREINFPTADRVWKHFAHGRKSEEEIREIRKFREIAEHEEHVARATKVIHWIKSDLVNRARSDYELNLCTLVVNDLTESKHLGIVCSALAAYQRHLNEAISYAKRPDLKKSVHVGKKGDKIEGVEVTVYQVRSFSGNYGPTTLVKFIDANGNLLTWFASKDREFIAGEKVVINSARIKEHKSWDGIKETLLSHVKVA